MRERVSGPNGFPPADRPFRHCHRYRTQGIRRGGRIAAEYDPFGYSAPVVEHRDKTRSRMRRERCPARKFARSVIARGRRQRPSHGHPAGRRPTVALGPPARNPLASERFSNNRPPSGRAIRYINKSLLPRTEAPNGTIPGNGARPANKLDGIGKTNATAKPNLAAKTGAPHKRGSSGEEVSGSRQRTTGILSWRTDTRSARHRLSTHLHRSFRFPWQTGRLARSRGQTKKPTHFASARRTAYRNRTSICRLRIYRPNR